MEIDRLWFRLLKEWREIYTFRDMFIFFASHIADRIIDYSLWN